MSLVINALMLTGPLYMLQIYDRVLASGSLQTLAVISAMALLLFVFYGLLEGLRGRVPDPAQVRGSTRSSRA